MRDYGKVSPMFWSGNTGREIRKRGQTAQLAALYLMTAPSSNMLGVFHVPVVMVSHAIGSPFEGALEALRSLSEVGFCIYDEESEWVWVCEMAKYQVADELDPKDNRVKSVAKDWLALPQLPFLQDFFDRFGVAFHLPERKIIASPFKAPSKPLRSQEQEQEQEQEQDERVFASDAVAPSATDLQFHAEQLPPEPAAEELLVVAVQPRSTKKRIRRQKSVSKTGPTWDAYASAYEQAYGAVPISNLLVNSQLSRFVDRVGAEEAPAIAAFYITHPNSYYLNRGHTVGCLLSDAEKLRTEWATNRVTTSVQARSHEKTASNPFAKIASEMRQEETRANT